MPSSAARSISRSIRRSKSALVSAVRVRLTTDTTICATSRERAGSWKYRKICDQVPSARISSTATSRKVCHSKVLGSQVLRRAGVGDAGPGEAFWACVILRSSVALCIAAVGGGVVGLGRTLLVVGHEYVAESPHGLDVARLGGVILDQFAQARDLHVDRAVEDPVFATARKLHQLVA